jgi:SAM-dependent methyltransferase
LVRRQALTADILDWMPHSLAAESVRERNRRLFASPFGAIYDFYMWHERVGRLVAWAIWGSDIRPYYASMDAIGKMPNGATIVDAPCGSGVALRALRPDQRVRYLGFDLSPAMVGRARRRADELGLDQVTLAEAHADALPVEDDDADLFLSYFGLHCFPDPAAALHEAARCLRPGGRLVGSTIVRGERELDRVRVRPGRGAFGPVGDDADLRRWLTEVGLRSIEVERYGVFAVFRARKAQ